MESIFSIFSDISQLVPVEAVYSSTGAYFSVNPSFRLVLTSVLFSGNIIVLFWGFFW